MTGERTRDSAAGERAPERPGERARSMHSRLSDPGLPREEVEAVAEEDLDLYAAEQVYNHPNTSTRARIVAAAAAPTLKARTHQWLKATTGAKVAEAIEAWSGDRHRLGEHVEEVLGLEPRQQEVYAQLVADHGWCSPDEAERLLAIAREVG